MYTGVYTKIIYAGEAFVNKRCLLFGALAKLKA